MPCFDRDGIAVALPDDPGLSLDDWTIEGGSLVDDRGQTAALFISTAMAAEDAHLATDVDMPDCFVPMALSFWSAVYVDNQSLRAEAAPGALLGGVPFDLDTVGGNGMVNRCVGARAYGGMRRLEIRPRSESRATVGEVLSPSLHLELGCPLPGTVVPFEDWLLDEDPARATIVDGNLDLHVVGSCDQTIVSGPFTGAIGLPDEAGVGVRIVVDSDQPFIIGDDGTRGMIATFGAITQRLEPGDNLICVPSGMRGTTNRLQVVLSNGGGSCNEEEPQHAVVHLPEVVRGACDDVTVPGGSTAVDGSAGFVSLGYPTSTATFVDDTFVVEAVSSCGGATLQLAASIPVPTATSGPALVTRHTRDAGATAWWGIAGTGGELESTVGSTTAATTTTCLPTSRAGEVQVLTVNVGTTSGSATCAVPHAGRFVLERVDVVLDEACAP